jgi:hypothetical protein
MLFAKTAEIDTNTAPVRRSSKAKGKAPMQDPEESESVALPVAETINGVVKDPLEAQLEKEDGLVYRKKDPKL